MVQINFAKGEVQCKVVYYGPARSGKTANLRSIHERSPEHVRGTLTTIATDTDRTLFFDYLPLNLGNVAGIGTKINLYAVPYIERQNATRLLVLEGIDGIVFVVDSVRAKLNQNIEALANLRHNVKELGRDLSDIPLVFQWNKSDAPDALAETELSTLLNPDGLPAFSAAADTGAGVFSCLKAITQGVLVNVTRMVPMPDPAARHEPPPESEREPVRRALQSDPALDSPPEAEPELEPAIAAAETDPEPLLLPSWRRDQPELAPAAQSETDEFPELLPAPEPELEPAEHGILFEQPTLEPAEPGLFDAPAPVMESAEHLAPLEAFQDPLHTDTFETAGRQAPPVVAGPRKVRVGGRVIPTRSTRAAPRPTGWDSEREPRQRDQHRPIRPVLERRQRPRIADRSPVPARHMVAGGLCALASLAAIGYLVHTLL